MRIVELRVENFKRVKAVRIRPDRSLVQITGPNGAGKSSVLDSIIAALGGKEAAPAKPIRDGADSATITLDLGALRVRRRFNPSGSSTLTVERKDGTNCKSPQGVLDELYGHLSFDPLAFSRMPDKQKAATLRQLTGYDTSQIDAERARLYEERTRIGRDVKALQGQIQGLEERQAPAEEVALSELAKQHAAAVAVQAVNAEERRKLERLELAGTKAHQRVAAAEKELVAARAAFTEAGKAYAAQEAAVEALVEPDLAAIATQMEQAESINAAVRSNKARVAKVRELSDRESEAGSLTEQIKAIDEKKAEALAAARFPVAGLGIDGDAVIFNGVPFDQASSAEQIRIGLAIGAALNPKLRVVLVRDGSLLDATAMRTVAEWAEASDMQVLMERVADGTPAGIVIEDGEVVEALGGPPQLSLVGAGAPDPAA